ncbi:MAG: methylenetetrahydrofolate--tRNA-(uracil(54)-C(5))-methyltransferase (FADH(2)-oxidizing) TrmFO [Magnetococcales bacterium]|nr:methylenetetrahydrofolate--tRNA-(uracil(54)-C(5))-methyltransferase (FADH(2)-oxidizing) TrmFO [Magnetococcales bacterium]NGZ06379.1 methylenetetrahydrofolate--tRNA-(uracil(54)-C(5))-methyltransferase (FADH(2)-oxidizing) TrmFO [Magnetococcales bacterium]
MRSMVRIIGAGLAGSEAAWQLAQRGVTVQLYEMRPHRFSPAHTTDLCAELVCSNSLRADDWQHNAVGLLHQEMRQLDSLILAAADANRTPAGGALAADRTGFAQWITNRLTRHPNITLIREEITSIPESGCTLIATGPLTSDGLAAQLAPLVGTDQLYFYDSLAPIVTLESIDFNQAFRQSRYNKGGDDYINCPLTAEQYHTFIAALLQAEQVPCRPFEKPIFFEGCLPIEVMAARGVDTLRFGPMKPVGLNNPHQNNTTPHAVVQLRQDNTLGTLWNLVGFQTKLTWPEQKRIFRTIPGLEQAEFARLGAIHRNTYINGPKVLDDHLRIKNRPEIFMAGQITGVEGYVESAACGLLAGLFAAHQIQHGSLPPTPPAETAHGALLRHVTAGNPDAFQPMNITFGLLPPLTDRCRKIDRKPLMAKRALHALETWKNT